LPARGHPALKGLRNTPHGLYVAVSIADAFLEEGEIVSVKGGSPEKIDHFNARPATSSMACRS
jgi:C-terminal processing protease CtpA/Prc